MWRSSIQQNRAQTVTHQLDMLSDWLTGTAAGWKCCVDFHRIHPLSVLLVLWGSQGVRWSQSQLALGERWGSPWGGSGFTPHIYTDQRFKVLTTCGVWEDTWEDPMQTQGGRAKPTAKLGFQLGPSLAVGHFTTMPMCIWSLLFVCLFTD